MATKTFAGNTMKHAPRCPECGLKVRKVVDFITCPRCKQRLPITEFGHHAGRPTHRTIYCRSCRTALDRTRQTGRATGLSKKKIADEYPPLGPLGEYNEIRADTITGIVESVEMVYAWADVDSLKPEERVVPAFTSEGRAIHKVTLRDTRYSDEETDPEAWVYLGEDGSMWFLTDDDYCEGGEVQVRFDESGNASQLIATSA